ncbi:MAG: hypothetical protein U0835_03315 [Isosphaeraceae bacterium]
MNVAAVAVWLYLVVRWVKQSARTGGRRAGGVECHAQVAAMSAVVLAAVLAPVKVVDEVKARRITLPKPVMTVAELREPEDHDYPRPFRYYMVAPDGWNGRAVRFTSKNVTIGEFIDAVEGQTPLRHRFAHCGNGWTLHWGGDCSFGLAFSPPTP